MAEYIERDKLIGNFLEKKYSGTENKIEYGEAVNLIQHQPTADVQEVRHGKWMGTVCTNCGESTSFYYDCHYCPICGAKMDKE